MTTDWAITLNEIVPDHASFVCALTVTGLPRWFPVVVTCTLKTWRGQFLDVPARWLVSPGLAVWRILPPKECQQGRGNPFNQKWAGQILFTVYADSSRRERLADTGWHRWSARTLVGSVPKDLPKQFERLRQTYGSRLDVWRPVLRDDTRATSSPSAAADSRSSQPGAPSHFLPAHPDQPTPNGPAIDTITRRAVERSASHRS